MYWRGRFFTVTGHRISVSTEIAARPKQLAKLWKVITRNKKAQATSPQISTERPVLSGNRKEVVELASRAKNGDKFRQLWEGKWQGNYTSQSEADQALTNLLAFYTGRTQRPSMRYFASRG
jgi:putative DNA primase/helicase